jgi:hypothetical protein
MSNRRARSAAVWTYRCALDQTPTLYNAQSASLTKGLLPDAGISGL